MSYPNHNYPPGPPLPDPSRTSPTQAVFIPGYHTRPPMTSGYMPVRVPKEKSLTSLVLGLASILMGWTFTMPIVGLVFGILGLKREPAGRTMAISGIVLNSICLALWLVLSAVAIWILVEVAAGSSAH